ncbi:Capsid protein VP1, partial [Folsomia candida]
MSLLAADKFPLSVMEYITGTIRIWNTKKLKKLNFVSNLDLASYYETKLSVGNKDHTFPANRKINGLYDDLYANGFMIGRDMCRQRNGTITSYELTGHLPIMCEVIDMCSQHNCLKLRGASLIASQFFTKGKHQIPVRHKNLGACYILEKDSLSEQRNYTRKRAAILVESKPKPRENYDGLSFNLPGYRYCGPGTDVEKMDDLGGPINSLDAACRQHDVDYLLGRDPLAADQKLLKSVQWHRPDLAPIFVTAMEAKRQFENYFGKHYTSFLYYYPTTFQPSIVFTFAQHSDFDSIKLTSKEAASAFIKVNEIENKWMTLLEEVWLGSCYTLSPSLAEEFKLEDGGDDNRREGDQSASLGPSGPEHPPGHHIPSIPPLLEPEDPDGTGASTSNSPTDYPLAPYKSGCRIIINEVAMQNSENRNSFIEHKRICPQGAYQPKSTSLSGFIEVVLEAGHTINLVMLANFKNYALSSVIEPHGGTGTGPRDVRRFYFVVGNEEIGSDMKYTETQRATDFENGMPSAQDKTYCVVLLKTHHLTSVPELDLEKIGDSYTPTPLSDEAMTFIQDYVQDVLIIGPPCSEDLCG